MITGYYCTNIFSEHAKELIDFQTDNLDLMMEGLKKKNCGKSYMFTNSDEFPFIKKLQSIKSEIEEEIKYVDMSQMWKRI